MSAYLCPIIRLRTIDGVEIVRQANDVSRDPNQSYEPLPSIVPRGILPDWIVACEDEDGVSYYVQACLPRIEHPREIFHWPF